MRIIAGKWRGSKLLPPPGDNSRPVLDQVKEAVFNILGARLASPGILPPLAVLDLFSGVGSFGLEALSRGAAFCTFVERHRETAQVLMQNVDKLRAQHECEVKMNDGWRFPALMARRAEPIRLVFIDPPYRDAQRVGAGSRVQRLLSSLASCPALEAETLLVLRHPLRSVAGAEEFPHQQLIDQRHYGEMTISILQQATRP
ncbi:MAG: hypothetical protein HJJLKODD_01517 [Phycisphaerae bacterium]|nr:hypothetical protein [Phycisphaerae bacterium]